MQNSIIRRFRVELRGSECILKPDFVRIAERSVRKIKTFLNSERPVGSVNHFNVSAVFAGRHKIVTVGDVICLGQRFVFTDFIFRIFAVSFAVIPVIHIVRIRSVSRSVKPVRTGNHRNRRRSPCRKNGVCRNFYQVERNAHITIRELERISEKQIRIGSVRNGRDVALNVRRVNFVGVFADFFPVAGIKRTARRNYRFGNVDR